MAPFPEESSAQPPPNPDAATPAGIVKEHTDQPSVDCWRCGKAVAGEHPTCPYCAAKLRDDVPDPSTANDDASADGLVRMLYFFGGLLAISVGHGLMQYAQAIAGEGALPSPEAILTQIGVFELISTALVLAALTVARVPSVPAPSPKIRAAAWLLAGPLLGCALAFNIGYHWFLLEVVGVPALESEFAGRFDLFVWLTLLICVQPAVVEELFFRYIAVNALHSVMGPVNVVMLSAVMFGLAHIGVPLSIPMLIALGAVLGWMRIASGGLLLPILMHFIHNVVVIYLETAEVLS